IAGVRRIVDAFTAGREVLHTDTIGALASVTVRGGLDDGQRAAALDAGLEVVPVSLQELVVRAADAAAAPAREPLAG
ncbi:hypothetical protein ACC691_38305, partial [Rhizobium johnstonii]|uniref:hypothetical protein n=1 Tax=Rhizobium johnstonii TaxID=3019933 RepID=UPI003F9556B5